MILVNLEEKKETQRMFFGNKLGIARYDSPRFPTLMSMTLEMRGRFWQPYEIDVSQDKRDFEEMEEYEKFIFLTVLSRQIALDSIQQRGPIDILKEHSSVPELEPLLGTWAFFEQIHSESYSHTVNNVLKNPGEFFDSIPKDPFIRKCIDKTTEFYQKFSDEPSELNLLLCLFSVNALEAIQFYSSFLCSFAFVQNKKMVKNGKIIQLIMRDEQIHKNISAYMIKALMKDEVIYRELFNQNIDKIQDIYKEVVNMEKEFVEYVFSKGSMVGLNANMVNDYIDYITGNTLKSLKIPVWDGLKKFKKNPVPFIDEIAQTQSVQDAPQEQEKIDYLIGVVKQDLSENFHNLRDSVDKLSQTIVYSKPSCPYCVELKQHLKNKGIKFEEKTVGVDITIEELQEKLGKPVRTVPQLILNGEYIGGCDDFKREFL